MNTLTGLAVAGVIGAGAVRQLCRGQRPPGEASSTAGTGRGPMESVLGGIGAGAGAAAGAGLRTAAVLTGASVRTVGLAGATTIERGLPAAGGATGWVLDGVGGLVTGTLKGVTGAVWRLVPHDRHPERPDGHGERGVLVGEGPARA
jgi:hypothetical protein